MSDPELTIRAVIPSGWYKRFLLLDDEEYDEDEAADHCQFVLQEYVVDAVGRTGWTHSLVEVSVRMATGSGIPTWGVFNTATPGQDVSSVIRDQIESAFKSFKEEARERKPAWKLWADEEDAKS